MVTVTAETSIVMEIVTTEVMDIPMAQTITGTIKEMEMTIIITIIIMETEERMTLITETEIQQTNKNTAVMAMETATLWIGDKAMAGIKEMEYTTEDEDQRGVLRYVKF